MGGESEEAEAEDDQGPLLSRNIFHRQPRSSYSL